MFKMWTAANVSIFSPPLSFCSMTEYDENGDRVVLGKGTYGIVYAGRDLSNQVRSTPLRKSQRETAGTVIVTNQSCFSRLFQLLIAFTQYFGDILIKPTV